MQHSSRQSATLQRVGVIGLGIMGGAMAFNLLRAGFHVTVHNRTPSRMESFVRAGADKADTPADLAAKVQVVITNVTDSPDVAEVLFGPQGVVHGAEPGLIVIDMSTISPEATRQTARQLAQRNIEMLDAPVTGGDVGARKGTLSIMVGGPYDVFERCRPVLEALGQTIVHVGGPGAGQTVKLVNQVVVALNLLAMAEGLSFAAKSGVDLQKTLSVLRAGAAGSWALDNLAPRVLAGDFAPGFTVALQQKDLRLALEHAEKMQLPLPGTSLAQQLLRSVEAYGGHRDGTQGVVRALERLGNFEIVQDSARDRRE